MSTTTFTTVVTSSSRNATIRTVKFTMPHVCPPGVDWAPGLNHGGRKFELTSFKGGAVEVYVEDPTTGIYMYQGNVRSYAPGESLRTCFKDVWVKEQPSAAALKSFEMSAAER